MTKFGLKKLQISLYHVVQNLFGYLEPFRKYHVCDRQTDEKTDVGRTTVNNTAVYQHMIKCELTGCTESNRIEFDTESYRFLLWRIATAQLCWNLAHSCLNAPRLQNCWICRLIHYRPRNNSPEQLVRHWAMHHNCYVMWTELTKHKKSY